MDEYVTVKVPKGLIEEVDKIVMNKSRGFRSRSEFCIHSIRKEVEMQNRKDVYFDNSHSESSKEVMEALLAPPAGGVNHDSL